MEGGPHRGGFGRSCVACGEWRVASIDSVQILRSFSVLLKPFLLLFFQKNKIKKRKKEILLLLDGERKVSPVPLGLTG